MRLLKFVVGILLLRRLPFGCLTSWLVRLGVWSLLGAAVSRWWKRNFGDLPGAPREPAPSGWTAPPPPPVPGVDDNTETAASLGFAATVTEPVTWQPDTIDTVTEATSSATRVSVSTSEEPEVVAEFEEAVEERLETEAEETLLPRWVKGDGSLDCPDDYPVKGNINSLIFHEPGGNHYGVTIPEVCFASAEDAIAAGYRRPKR